MKTKSLFIALGLVFFCFACEDSFVPDPFEPGLNKYTTNGANSFGAMINAKPWVSEYECRLIYGCDREYVINSYRATETTRDSAVLIVYNNYGSVSINFPGRLITSLDDLAAMEGEEFTMDGTEAFGLYMPDNSVGDPCIPEQQNGKFTIRYTEEILDNTQKGLIIAGTFGFDHYEGTCEALEVHHGRFDITITANDIHVYTGP